MNLAYLDRLLTSIGIAAEFRGIFWILLILALTAVVAILLARILVAIERKLSSNDNLWDDVFLHAARRPVYWYLWLQGLYWASEVGQRFYGMDHLSLNDLALRFGFIILLVWCLLRFVGQAEELMTSDRVAEPMDYTTVSAMGKLARVIIVVIATLVIIQNLGYSISGVLAFGGVGGRARWSTLAGVSHGFEPLIRVPCMSPMRSSQPLAWRTRHACRTGGSMR